MPFIRFDNAKDVKLPPILHEIGEEDIRGSKLPFKGFKSCLLVDARDFEVSFLHVIFDLKGVLVGKEYFSINHLLPLPYSVGCLPILLNKRVIPRPSLKEFLMKCIE